MAAPYTMVKFMPTGGISAKNLKDYLSFGKILCCGGSWMVKGDMIRNGEFDKIRELTKEAVELGRRDTSREYRNLFLQTIIHDLRIKTGADDELRSCRCSPVHLLCG